MIGYTKRHDVVILSHRINQKRGKKKMEITCLNSFAPLSVIITAGKLRPDNKLFVKYSYTELHEDSINDEFYI